MIRQIGPVSALLLGSALLLFAGGINGLILPVRGSFEGFSPLSLGMLGTGWAIGYVAGCILTPMLVQRVGHVRTFSIMAAGAAISILGSLIFLTPLVWIPLRALCGFCFAGAAMIVESWLNERAEASNRGRIFGIYTMINLFANTGGQMMLIAGDTTGYLFFVLGAIFYCMALIPTAVSSSASPLPLVSVKLNLKALWRNSPVAVFGVLMIGISNSAFGTLAAVYGNMVGLEVSDIAVFASLPILFGALFQLPIGWLSDRIDRRKALVGVAVFATVIDISFLILAPQSWILNIALVSLFGGAIFSMYPIIISHASDHAEQQNFIQISGGLLLLFGVGGFVGPLIAGAAMSSAGPLALFATTLCSHLALTGFAIWRIFRRAPVPQEEKNDFFASPLARSSTPETFNLASDTEATEQNGK